MLRKILPVIVMLTGFVGISTANAHGPSRLKVSESVTINASADKVWETVGAFDSLSWLPPVTKVVMESGNPTEKGAVRVVYVGDQSVTEEIKRYNADAMMIKYKITKNNTALLPVTNYQSTIKVKPEGDKSVVTWNAGFYRGYPNNDPPENLNDAAAIAAISGLYKAGLDNLKTEMEK
ncbi:SRPBCC family protein [Grimontia hollisae]|uniref:MxaD protein n=2 Tax=Grimontia hollisae TaxID=673 RepID=D0I7U8_GRIHO|nr:SRPBCC family protein [Grimontia hollisae]AMG31148.1 SRPBCC family protein [Grimontia hollisae]EEY72717.1 MxaD protein [Grimontia hollisae CIP 101886]STO46513.1 Polyketide cyclase / dehydrase and lipid transport [Grimontia hollisae]STO58293.1 Polyketide cyclase / dehydrase and lipid transport [Grimontia hollisae]